MESARKRLSGGARGGAAEDANLGASAGESKTAARGNAYSQREWCDDYFAGRVIPGHQAYHRK